MDKKTRLIIARHGNTFGPEDIVRRLGLTDIPLVESGFHQGTLLGEYLKHHHLIPDVIFVSELQRTQQTADQILAVLKNMKKTIPVEPLAMFNEIDYGPDENQPEAEIIERIGADALKAWDEKAIVPDGWNVDPKMIIKHWQNFAEKLVKHHESEKILVVTSNGIARFAPYLTANFEHFSQQHKIKIATGALCIFEYNPKKEVWDCVQWNVKP